MSSFQDRWYQDDAVEATFNAIKDDTSCHPVIVAPTGSGKTIIICKLIDEIISFKPTSNVLILAADKRILEQNKYSIEDYFEGIEVGLCSAGLHSYDIRKITVAGVQSVFRKPEDFLDFDYIIIDECHMINTKQTGMYRKFLEHLDANYIGLTATHFRTGHGYIHEGKDALFNDISYDMSSPEIYNRIVEEGYLSQLFAYPTAIKLSGDGCRTTAGDWNEKDLSIANDRDSITQGAITEVLYYGKKYKHWLFFAIDIKHCDNIVYFLKQAGINAVAVHSKADNVDQKIEDFKSGKYRAAVQVNMLTTGFDFPGIDLIADMRPTKSPIIHVQGKGRGGRVVYADGYDLSTMEGRVDAIANGPKPHCLVLDFSGNIERLGPINYVKIKKKGEKEGAGQAVTKQCKECNFINWGGAKFCENCGVEFEFKEKLKMEAGSADIVKLVLKKPIETKVEWYDVDSVSYAKFKPKHGGVDLVRITYICGWYEFSEIVNIDGKGYSRNSAKNWIKFRWDISSLPPDNVRDLISHSDRLKKPTRIKVESGFKYPKLVDSYFGEV